MYQNSPYHPQGNSIIERSHHTINNIIRAMLLEDNQLTWRDLLPAVQLTMNSAVHSAHTFPLAQIILGLNVRLPVDCQHHPQDSPLGARASGVTQVSRWPSS